MSRAVPPVIVSLPLFGSDSSIVPNGFGSSPVYEIDSVSSPGPPISAGPRRTSWPGPPNSPADSPRAPPVAPLPVKTSSPSPPSTLAPVASSEVSSPSPRVAVSPRMSSSPGVQRARAGSAPRRAQPRPGATPAASVMSTARPSKANVKRLRSPGAAAYSSDSVGSWRSSPGWRTSCTVPAAASAGATAMASASIQGVIRTWLLITEPAQAGNGDYLEVFVWSHGRR